MSRLQHGNHLSKPSSIVDRSTNLATHLGSLSFCIVAQQGILHAFPIIFIGIISLAIPHLPLACLQAGFECMLGPNWEHHLQTVSASTLGIASLSILCSMSYGFTHKHNQSDPNNYISPAATIIVSIACLFSYITYSNFENWQELLSIPKGLITAIVTATVSSYFFIWLAKKPYLRLRNSTVNGSIYTFDALRLLPASIITIITLHFTIYLMLASFPDHPSKIIDGYLISFAETLDSIFLLSLIHSFVSQVLWFFGLHGPNILSSVDSLFLTQPLFDNITLMQEGLPPTHIISRTFLNIFALYGGSGSTLCLIIAILWKGTDSNLKKLVLLSLIPALMNVNEPILFGLPILLNPIYFLPFVMVPLAQIIVSYCVTYLEWVPIVSIELHWTCPAILSGYLGTGKSISGSILQIANIALGIAVYLPFVKLSERVNARRMNIALQELTTSVCNEQETQKSIRYVQRTNAQGAVARHITHSIRQPNSASLHMEIAYQAQYDTRRKAYTGMEALLRWKHPMYGMVPPPVVIALAEDIDEINKLGTNIIHKVLCDISSHKDKLPDDFITSINVSPVQLQDPSFADNVINLIRNFDIPYEGIELEITENVAMAPSAIVLGNLKRLSAHGVHIAIDDFGMGHASLRYLRELPIGTIKVDKSLSDMSEGEVNLQVVESIVSLCQSLELNVIVEGVEDHHSLQRLTSVGCQTFQGYYFARPQPLEEALRQISQNSMVETEAKSDSPDVIHASA